MKQEAKNKRKLALWIFGAILPLLFIILLLLQSSNLWKSLSVETATDTLLLYALSSLNFVAFVIFAFIFIRNLLKLSRERKALQLGSKIKTRLLIYFFAVSLMPIVAMVIFSYLFMNRAIERWFTNIPENVVRSAYQVQNEATQARLTNLAETARFLTFMLENEQITNQRLNEIAEKAGLDRVLILSSDNRILVDSVAYSADYDGYRAYIPQSDGSVVQNENGSLVARADFSDGRKLLIFDSLSNQAEKAAERALEEFDKLKAQQIAVRQIGLSTLGLLTMLLIFASGWIALHLSRGLAVPIKALAEGANEIAKGNLSHRVEVFAEDELALLVTAFNQMAERLQTNATELQRGKEYIETVLESLSTGVISLNADNKLTTINRTARKWLRLENKDITNLRLSEIIHPENVPVFEKILNRARKVGKASEQTVLRSLDESQGTMSDSIPVAVTATALPKGNGVVLVIEDLTELISAQRAAAWSEVARRMAHEIKNPLTPIQLSAERIAKKFEDEIKESNGRQDLTKLRKVIKEGTEIILSEVKSLKSMVDEFSRFARLPSAKLEPKNLNEVVRKTLLLYEDRVQQISIKTELATNLPECMLDEEQMKQVLVNLIDNAIEAFSDEQENKEIVIRTSFDEREAKVLLEVSDNATGIDPKHFPKLFQPYFSTKHGGTGLGLTIVHRIVTEHNGKIIVSKNFPRGTKFRIELLPA